MVTNLKKLTVFGVLLISIILLAGVLMLNFYRKEMPYKFEIIPLNEAVGLINTTKWNRRDFQIAYGHENGSKSKALMFGRDNEVIISGLKNGMEYKITINRHDILGKLKYKGKRFRVKPVEGKHKYVVLIGASVGRRWKFTELSKRLETDKYTFGYRGGAGGFDKKTILLKILSSKIKPEVVIIKECAAYFPRDLKDSKEKIDHYVRLLSVNGIRPLLATCAPVTAANDKKKPGRQSAINEFNKMIKNYALEKGIPLLDLHKALEDGSDMHYLREEYAKSDGLHLKEKAYREALDPIVIPSLSSLSVK